MLNVVGTKQIARTLDRYKMRNRQGGYSVHRSYDSTTRIYVHPKGETLLQNLCNRRNRPVKAYKEAVLTVRPDLTAADIRWSQKAGCSCGCSPAFVVNRKLRDDENKVIDLFIDVEAA